jgi:hypothetical protein
MSPRAARGRTGVTFPTLGSILLASRDPDRLRTWYGELLQRDADGTGLVIVRDDDLAATNPEPARTVLRVDDAPLAAVRDPDGNLLQRRRRAGSAMARVAVVIGSPAPRRLSAWYRWAFGLAGLVVPRPELGPRAREPQRFVPNVVVEDAAAVEARLIAGGAVWVRELESGRHGLIGTVLDPDGNYVQFIEPPRSVGRTERRRPDRTGRAARVDGPTHGGAGSSDRAAAP